MIINNDIFGGIGMSSFAWIIHDSVECVHRSTNINMQCTIAYTLSKRLLNENNKEKEFEQSCVCAFLQPCVCLCVLDNAFSGQMVPYDAFFYQMHLEWNILFSTNGQLTFIGIWYSMSRIDSIDGGLENQ